MEPTREILIGISDKLNQLKTVDEFHQSIQILQGENQKLAEQYNKISAQLNSSEEENQNKNARIQQLESQLEQLDNFNKQLKHEKQQSDKEMLVHKAKVDQLKEVISLLGKPEKEQSP